jgi:7-carboxy-7-deazaguanine synthase
MNLNITELFHSVQGETSLTGWPTAFIRLAGCPMRCSWCDTTYSFKRGTDRTLDELLQFVEKVPVRHVCITGGEPLAQPNVFSLMTALCDRGKVVSLETGGAISTAAVDPRVITILDVKCPGSGMLEKNCWENLNILRPQDEVKFVIADRTDYDFSKEICSQHGLYSKVAAVLFSPVWGQLHPRQLVEWMLADGVAARLNLQTHKYIWAPETRGV